MILNKVTAEKEVLASDVSPALDDFSAKATERGYEVDVLSQFKTNLQQVEELNSRLRFVLAEVSGLIKSR